MASSRLRWTALSPKRSPAPATFEAAFSELQKVVEQLERGGIDLENTLSLYDRGTELAKACSRLIDSAEQQVTRLTPESATPLPDAAVDP
ncbi:MAG: exodeoxyribonuclease VII small subunit [Chloroflexi bacterium]|nr:exodeoxyribonuclease VII small subunit [Chloroflexota bacterium]MBV9893604.1 exodeoxyribonuclease VII small subunit [Chloroflexota bacterium]